MFDEDPPPPRNNRKNPEPQFNWKGLALLAVSALFIAWAFIQMSDSNKNLMGGGVRMLFSEFQENLHAGKIICTKDKPLYLVKVPATGEEYLEGYYSKDNSAEGKPPGEVKFVTA